MGELAAVAGIASTAMVGGGSTPDRPMVDRSGSASGRSPPQPLRSTPAPATESHGPAVELVRQGLLLEALVRERAGAIPGSQPNELAGMVRVVPLAPDAPEPLGDPAARAGPWRDGARIATVLGPAGPNGLLAEAAGVILLLRGARLHLPPGARLRVAWQGVPRPLDRPAAVLGPAFPPPARSPASGTGPSGPSVNRPAFSLTPPPSTAAAGVAYGPAPALAANGAAPLPRRSAPSSTGAVGPVLENEPGTAGSPAAAAETATERAPEPEREPASARLVRAPAAGSSGANTAGASADLGTAAASPASAGALAESPEAVSQPADGRVVGDDTGTSSQIFRPLPTPADLPPPGEAARQLASLLGFAVEGSDPEDERRRGREGGSGEGHDPGDGCSRVVVALPELGRVQLLLSWSPKRVELAIYGLPPLDGFERAALLRAFEAALAAAGGRGRAVLVTSGGWMAADRPAYGESTRAPEHDPRGATG